LGFKQGALHTLSKPLGEANFVVVCDQNNREIYAFPQYHNDTFLPHVSLGEINQHTPTTRELMQLNHFELPRLTGIGDGIRYIEVSFKNAHRNFLYHYVYDTSDGRAYGWEDSEYKGFLRGNLSILS
jgi:hypothetical protein